MKKIFKTSTHYFIFLLLCAPTMVWGQSRDLILDYNRIMLVGVGEYKDSLWIYGNIEKRNSNTIAFQPFFAKIDPNLNVLREFYIPHDTIYDYYASGKFYTTLDNKIACIGAANTNEKYYLYNINTQGDILLRKEYAIYSHFKYTAAPHSFFQLPDSSYFFYGEFIDGTGDSSGGFPQVHYLIQRVDKKGESKWVKIGKNKFKNEAIFDAKYSHNQIVAGVSIDSTWWPFMDRMQYFSLYTFDTNGTIVKISNRLNHNKIGVKCFIPSADKGWLLGGQLYVYTDTFVGYPRGKSIVVKTDSNMNIQWQVGFDDTADYPTQVNKIIKLRDNNYVAVAQVSYDTNYKECTSIVKFNEQGKVIWQNKYKYTPLSYQNTDFIKDIIELKNGDLVGVGIALPVSLAQADTFRVQRGWILKLNSEGKVLSSIVSNDMPIEVKIYPNPFQDYLIIETDYGKKTTLDKVVLYDIAGKEVISTKIKSEKKAAISTSILEQGVYFIIGYNSQGQIVSMDKIMKN